MLLNYVRSGVQQTFGYGVAIFLLISYSVSAQQVNEKAAVSQEQPPEKDNKAYSILYQRQTSDSEALKNLYSISQHRLNYILPVSYVSDLNPADVTELDQQNIDNFEAKYQLSVKLPIYLKDDSVSGLYMGFTAVSFWQVYNSQASKPFRETNYEPEIFYSWQTNYQFLGIEFNQAQVGFNHQSNGQSGAKSRSWNRLFASALFSDEDSIYYLKTWYRIKEEVKKTPTSATGDDNPDITGFLGHFELGYGKKVGNFNILTLLRNNLKSDNKGSIELHLAYPINKRYDFVLQYFNGYGDSLIDYNHHQQRISMGVQLKFL
ncbi:phospholipase A [Aliiglaciecola litoralis]|uniref:Phospholipase A1 n=1 Tax=Aliiglaciecola litoralis TaxID=582857 RepID=A0ABN1LEB0_9ALTE